MKTAKLYIAIILGLCFSSSIKAQEILRLEDAVRIALENNYDIKLSRNLNEISKNDVTYGNAGMLPVVTGNLTDVHRIESTNVDLASGDTREADNAKTSNLNYGASVNWRIFDGFQMFANYDRLKELEKLGELNAKLTVQTTVADIITVYYDLVAQKKLLEAAHTALEISRQRYNYSNSRYLLGRASKLEVLASQVDLNADTTQLLRQIDLIRSTKVRLNEILARSLETDFEVLDTILIDQTLAYEELRTNAELQNPDLQTAVIYQKIADLNLKQVKGARYPVIALTSGYNFARSTAPPTSFSLRSNSNGLNYGLTASINIFNGFQQRRLEKNAALEIENSSLEVQRTRTNVNAQLLTAYQNYQTNLQLVTLEESNVNVAKENLNITLEKYRLGSIVPLELREAQRNFVDATARYANSQYETKLAEIALKELTGNISL